VVCDSVKRNRLRGAQVDLKAALIRLEDEQTELGKARTVPIPDALIAMLQTIEPKHSVVFDSTNLRKEWLKACDAVGLGTLDRKTWQSTGLIVHDLRRSAIKNLMKAGVSEKVAMTISGHKTRSVFDRYHIVDTPDALNAMRKVEALPVELNTQTRLLPAQGGSSLDSNGQNVV
jgi:integrase